jgi:hypothetical protein
VTAWAVAGVGWQVMRAGGREGGREEVISTKLVFRLDARGLILRERLSLFLSSLSFGLKGRRLLASSSHLKIGPRAGNLTAGWLINAEKETLSAWIVTRPIEKLPLLSFCLT